MSCSFLVNAVRSRVLIPAAVVKSADARLPDTKVPRHYRFTGGLGIAFHDRRRECGTHVNLVVGRGQNGKGWKRGYKQTLAVAIGHVCGHWPPPLPYMGACWFNLDNFSEIGLHCADHIMSFSRHQKS